MLLSNTEVISWLSDNVTIGLISGFVSSIFATVFIWLFYTLFTSYFIPKYQATVYTGVLIEGRWRNGIKNPESQKGTEGTLQLHQAGSKVEGVLTLKSVRPDQEDFIINYNMKGEIRNNQVFLFGSPTDRHKMSFVSGLFNIKNGGNILLGCSIGIDNYDGEIFARTEVEWRRTK